MPHAFQDIIKGFISRKPGGAILIFTECAGHFHGYVKSALQRFNYMQQRLIPELQYALPPSAVKGCICLRCLKFAAFNHPYSTLILRKGYGLTTLAGKLHFTGGHGYCNVVISIYIKRCSQ